MFLLRLLKGSESRWLVGRAGEELTEQRGEVGAVATQKEYRIYGHKVHSSLRCLCSSHFILLERGGDWARVLRHRGFFFGGRKRSESSIVWMEVGQ